MRNRLYRRAFRALVSITMAVLLTLIVSCMINVGNLDGVINSLNTREFFGLSLLLSFLMYMFFTVPEPTIERALAGCSDKNPRKNRMYSDKEIDQLESEARYAQEAEDYYNNPENHKQC